MSPIPSTVGKVIGEQKNMVTNIEMIIIQGIERKNMKDKNKKDKTMHTQQ